MGYGKVIHSGALFLGGFMDGFDEYVIFTVKNKAGEDVDMALVDEFDYKHKHYVVGAIVEGETINEDGLFIYRAVEKEDDFEAVKIESPSEYEEIAKAYMELGE